MNDPKANDVLFNHKKQFGTQAKILVQAPGRINLIGEHTDYNLGFVMPAAIDKAIYLAFSISSIEDKASLSALDLNENFEFNLEETIPAAKGAWQNYILGVVHEIQKIKGKIPGFQLTFGGDIPQGAGLSSSAALECGVCYALNQLFDLQLTWKEMAQISQKAEHNFVGTQCGIMDQISSLQGKANEVMLLDCRSLEIEYFPSYLPGYQLVICNSNVTHQLANSAYNERRAQCEEGVKILHKFNPSIQSLRDVDYDFLKTHEAELSEVVFRRCAYIIKENTRVVEFGKALKNQEVDTLKRLLGEAHEGMRYEYEITCPEIDFMVDYTKNMDHVKGSRMMGGGFGGCTLNIVEDAYVAEFKSGIATSYLQKYGKALSIYDIKIENGVHEIPIKPNKL